MYFKPKTMICRLQEIFCFLTGFVAPDTVFFVEKDKAQPVCGVKWIVNRRGSLAAMNLNCRGAHCASAVTYLMLGLPLAAR